MNGTLRTRNAQGEVTQEIVLDRTKGVHLNPESAMRLALSKTAESLEKTAGKKVAAALQ